MTPAARRKAEDILTRLTILEGVESGVLSSTDTSRLKAELFAAGRDLREELDRPIEVQPWTPWTPFGREIL